LKGVVLSRGNAYSHTAAHTAETLGKHKFYIMTHPPHSSDLASFGYHFFGTFKEAFTSYQEVKAVVHAWLTAQPKMFSYEDIRKLMLM
jgi:hypothetical protein